MQASPCAASWRRAAAHWTRQRLGELEAVEHTHRPGRRGHRPASPPTEQLLMHETLERLHRRPPGTRGVELLGAAPAHRRTSRRKGIDAIGLPGRPQPQAGGTVHELVLACSPFRWRAESAASELAAIVGTGARHRLQLLGGSGAEQLARAERRPATGVSAWTANGIFCSLRRLVSEQRVSKPRTIKMRRPQAQQPVGLGRLQRPTGAGHKNDADRRS